MEGGFKNDARFITDGLQIRRRLPEKLLQAFNIRNATNQSQAGLRRPSHQFDELAWPILQPTPSELLFPWPIMRGDDAVTKFNRLRIQHLDQAVNMRFIRASQHIIQNEDRLSRFFQSRQSQENTQPEGIQMRVTEVGLRPRVFATKRGANLERRPLFCIELEANFVQSFAGMNGFV